LSSFLWAFLLGHGEEKYDAGETEGRKEVVAFGEAYVSSSFHTDSGSRI